MPQIVPEITSGYFSYEEALENVPKLTFESHSFFDIKSSLGKITFGNNSDELFTSLGWSSFLRLLQIPQRYANKICPLDLLDININRMSEEIADDFTLIRRSDGVIIGFTRFSSKIISNKLLLESIPMSKRDGIFQVDFSDAEMIISIFDSSDFGKLSVLDQDYLLGYYIVNREDGSKYASGGYALNKVSCDNISWDFCSDTLFFLKKSVLEDVGEFMAKLFSPSADIKNEIINILENIGESVASLYDLVYVWKHLKKLFGKDKADIICSLEVEQRKDYISSYKSIKKKSKGDLGPLKAIETTISILDLWNNVTAIKDDLSIIELQLFRKLSGWLFQVMNESLSNSEVAKITLEVS